MSGSLQAPSLDVSEDESATFSSQMDDACVSCWTTVHRAAGL